MGMIDRLVLAMDGSTRVCGAALLRLRAGVGVGDDRWEVVARRAEVDSRGQAKLLLRLVDELLREVQAGTEDLGAVVVGTGPGTFTGVRITVATGRALSLALSVPVLGVSTLGALAACAAAASTRVTGPTTVAVDAAEAAVGLVGVAVGPAAASRPSSPSLLVPFVDARRGQVFYGVYEALEPAEAPGVRPWVRTKGFGVCDRGALGGVVAEEAAGRGGLLGAPGGAGSAALVAEDRTLAGDLPAGVEFVAFQVEAEHLVVGQELLYEPGEHPVGGRLTPWLENALAASGAGGRFHDDGGSSGAPESVKPVYVRSPDADIHITRMKDPWADGSGGR